jgi:hypothetical protein
MGSEKQKHAGSRSSLMQVLRVDREALLTHWAIPEAEQLKIARGPIPISSKSHA